MEIDPKWVFCKISNKSIGRWQYILESSSLAYASVSTRISDLSGMDILAGDAILSDV